MSEGFIKIRNGIDDHLRMESLSLFEFGVYVQILRQADYETGVWFGGATRLINDAPRDASEEKFRQALKHLTRIGFLKSFRRGRRKNTNTYLINKFSVTQGVHVGERVNADATTDWRKIVYEDAAVGVAVDAASAPHLRRIDAALTTTSQDKDKEKDRIEGRKVEGAPDSFGIAKTASPAVLPEATPTPVDGQRPETVLGFPLEIHEACKQFFALLYPAKNPDRYDGDWLETLSALVDELKSQGDANPLPELMAMAKWGIREAPVRDDFCWREKIVDMKSFAKPVRKGTLPRAYFAAKRKSEAKEEKEAKPKALPKGHHRQWL